MFFFYWKGSQTMNLRLLALLPALLLSTFVLAQETRDRSDKELIAELKQTLNQVLKEQEKARDREQLAERCKKLTEKAENLLQEFEKAVPKSPLLAEARATALRVYDES